MRIGLDFDGVCVDSHPLKAVIARELFGVDIPSDFFQRKWVLESNLLTPEEYQRVGDVLFSRKHQLPEVKNAVGSIKKLLASGQHCEIITSRSGVTLEPVHLWMETEGLALPVTGVGYGISKEMACRGLDVFVDDDVTKLTPLVGCVETLIHFRWSHNHHELLPNGIHQVDSWTMLIDFLEERIR